MKLLLRRDQKSGMTGRITFTLEVRADISPEERGAIDRYKLGKTVLFQDYEITERGSGLLGLASRAAIKALNLTITVNDLANGKRVECKDIVEMLAAEEQIRAACQHFKAILEAASQFGGEELIEV